MARHSEDDFLPRYPERASRRVFLALQRGLYWGRVGQAYVKAAGACGAIIFEYHSVAPAEEAQWIEPSNRISPEQFEAQMSFLARHRNVVSMDEVVDATMSGRALPAGSVALTFDDGYRDNLTHVAHVLERYGFPATIYVPTGLVTRQESPWPDRLYAAFLHRRNDRFDHPNVPGSPFVLTGERARAAYGAVAGALLNANRDERDALLSALYEQLDPDVNPPCLTLDWESLKTMQTRFPSFAIGVHSTNHVDLTAHGTDVAAKEIEQCIADYAQHLGGTPKHFAYPYDRHDGATHEVLSNSVLMSGVGSGDAFLIDDRSDRFALARLEPPASMSLYRFWSSGAYPGLPQRIFGRA